MTKTFYRTRVASLLRRALQGSGTGDYTSINKRAVAADVGVSHQVFYDWWNADSDNSDNWLTGYHSSTVEKFVLFFAALLEVPPDTVVVIEPIIVEDEPENPTWQERHAFARH